MRNRLPLPPELMLLMEKRGETDRRTNESCTEERTTESKDLADTAPAATDAPDADAATKRLRASTDRRASKNRRRSAGRKSSQ